MAKFVGSCVVVFVLAVGFVALNQAQDLAALFEAFRAETPAEKLAWLAVVVIPLVLIPSALWLCDALLRQRRATAALELRLGGVRQGARDLARSQVDADAAVHHLARTDPEAAIGALGQRLTEAERAAQVQERRNDIGDLQSRVDELRAVQERLRERLAPVLQKRRSIEQLFAELDSRQNDIERVLVEVAGGDDAAAIDVRLTDLTEFIRRGHERCDEMEGAAKTIAGLKEDYAELRARLAPHAAAKDGIRRRIKDLDDVRDRLAADIDALQQTPQGNLAARVQAFADDKNRRRYDVPGRVACRRIAQQREHGDRGRGQGALAAQRLPYLRRGRPADPPCLQARPLTAVHLVQHPREPFAVFGPATAAAARRRRPRRPARPGSQFPYRRIAREWR